MTERLKPHVAQAIAALEAAYPTFAVEERHWPVWNQMLGAAEPRALAAAVVRVIDSHTHGVPGLPQLRQAVFGRWTVKKIQATDCHGNLSADAPYREFHVLEDPTTGAVLRAFDSQLNLIHWPAQHHIASRSKVEREMAHLLPPGELDKLRQIEARASQARAAELPERVDFTHGIPQ